MHCGSGKSLGCIKYASSKKISHHFKMYIVKNACLRVGVKKGESTPSVISRNRAGIHGMTVKSPPKSTLGFHHVMFSFLFFFSARRSEYTGEFCFVEASISAKIPLATLSREIKYPPPPVSWWKIETPTKQFLDGAVTFNQKKSLKSLSQFMVA